MLETILIARHAFRANFVDSSITTSVTGMNRDPPLAAYGLTQSEYLAAFLESPSEEDGFEVPELIFSSPFYRCLQTSSYLAKKLKKPLLCEHGAMEWYSPAKDGTGLHPRPAMPDKMAQYFEPGLVSTEYKSTLYPSRRGETMHGLQTRCDTFLEAWIARIEDQYPEVKTVVLFAHAASVIAMGRSLTGERKKEIRAGCASTSLYRRRSPKASSQLGNWDCPWNGKTSYLPNGEERNWGFDQVVLSEEGEVIEDSGDGEGHQPEDELPHGLAPGFEKYLPSGSQRRSSQARM